MTAQQLKNSILQLAVQGKLVPQDPNDEPASALLERIRAEKEQLIKDGKLKKEKPLPPITDDEIPFDVPDSWEWVRLGDAVTIKSSKRIFESDYVSSGVPFYRSKEIGDLSRGENIKSEYFISKAKFDDINERFGSPKKGDIMITSVGTIGNCWVSDGRDFYYKDGNVTQILYSPTILSDLILLYLESPLFFLQAFGTVAGTAYNALTIIKFNRVLFPLPPLAEQHRIVERIAQLLPHIADYDTAEQKLTALNAKFPDQLKKSILQSAVQGKLVQQDKNDEPASVLLDRIRAEKEQLIKDGKLKKEKPLPPIAEDEIPFDLPESWEWVRLGSLINKLTDGAHHTPNYTESGVPFLSVKDISSGSISFNNTKFISTEEHSELYKRCDPEKGDILLTKVGTTGIPVLIDTDREFSLFVSVALLKFNQDLLYGKYLVRLLESPLVGLQCAENTRGVGNKNWVIRDIANTLVVLPPLAEQHRIVAKCEDLMSYVERCDWLCLRFSITRDAI